jgi:hypothetical protein
MPGRALRVAGIAKCKTLLYVETISAKGSTAQQKNIFNTRNGWKRSPKPSEEV